MLKTFDPPPTALYGREVTGANRWGKYLGLQVGEFHLITHLSRAGWLRWSEKLGPAPLKPGKGPIALRVHLGDGEGFDLTEAGTQKRLAVWIVRDPAAVPGIAALGPDALELTGEQLTEVLAGHTGRLKTVITDQKVIAGIGNAYSDEILHADTGAAMRGLLAEQVTLIKSIPLDAAKRVHELTLQGIEDATRANEIAKEIQRSGEVATSRAQLIARTEVSRTAATLTEARAKATGSEGYIWRDSGDKTTRHSHHLMNGKYVRWDSPPTLDKLTGHAGCLPNCRCWPDPVIPE